MLRLLPKGLQQLAVRYWYDRRAKEWAGLYKRSELVFAPGVFMEDLVVGDIISGRIAFTGVWGLDFSRTVAKLGAAGGGLMVDVGANMGYFSLLWAASAPNNRVVAIEASPRNHGMLKKNIELNGMQDRIKMLPFAVGNEKGTLPFVLGTEEQTGWGGLTNRDDEPTVMVDVERIDRLLETDEPIALMKIDIEGADTWAIEGCEALLRKRQIKELWFEENKPRMAALGIEPGAAGAFLRSCGYEVQAMTSTRKLNVEWRARPRR